MFVMTTVTLERSLDIHVNTADTTDVVRRILVRSGGRRGRRLPRWWPRLSRV